MIRLVAGVSKNRTRKKNALLGGKNVKTRDLAGRGDKGEGEGERLKKDDGTPYFRREIGIWSAKNLVAVSYILTKTLNSLRGNN